MYKKNRIFFKVTKTNAADVYGSTPAASVCRQKGVAEAIIDIGLRTNLHGFTVISGSKT